MKNTKNNPFFGIKHQNKCQIFIGPPKNIQKIAPPKKIFIFSENPKKYRNSKF